MQSVHPPSGAGVTGIADKLPSQCPVVVTGLLILARAILASLGLPAPTVVEILAATHVSRSTAYETHDVLARLLPTLIRARGRPAKPPPAATDQGAALTRAVLGYVTHHAGCVQRGPVRQHYSDGFRRYIVELRAEHAALDVEPFASAVDVPLGTLKDWLRDPIAAAVSTESAASPPPDADSAQMQTVLDAWTRWDGTFIGFCDHVRAGLLVPFGREAVAQQRRQPCHRRVRRPRPRNRQPPASHLLARLARRRAPFARGPRTQGALPRRRSQDRGDLLHHASRTTRRRPRARRLRRRHPVVGHPAPARALRAPGAQRSPCADVGYATEGVSQPVAI